MAIQDLKNPLEINHELLIKIANGRSEYKELIHSDQPIFIFGEDAEAGKLFIGNKNSNNILPIPSRSFLSKKIINR